MKASQFAGTITIAEAARLSGVHPNSLRYWINRGDVETVPTPLGKLVVRESLNEYLRTREEPREQPTVKRRGKNLTAAEMARLFNER